MVTRNSFHEELITLKNLVLKMGSKAANALQESVEALATQDVERALKVIDDDYKINRIDREINEKAIWLFAKESPVASDLRRILSSIKIATDLERVGDLAVNISKSTIRIADKELFKPLKEITLMAEKGKSMLDQVIDAYNEEDAERAREIADLDNNLDEMYGRIVQELLSHMVDQPEIQSQVTQLAFVCRDLERIGDHVTNISEHIIFTKIGQLSDLNE